MTSLFCRQRFLEESVSQQKALKLAKLKEIRKFLASRSAFALDESHAQDVFEMLKGGLLRRLWEPDAAVLGTDAGDIAQMQGQERAELVLLYEILGAAGRLAPFRALLTPGFVGAVTMNLRSADAVERKMVTGFVVDRVKRAPALRQPTLARLTAMIDGMTQTFAAPCVCSILALLREFSPDPRQVVAAHVLPLLGNPGLHFFADVLLPWLCELATDRAFRDRLLARLIRSFPVASRKTTTLFLMTLGRVAVSVPQPLVRRFLSLVASCVDSDEEGLRARALEVAATPCVANVIDRALPADVTPMLETLFLGTCRKSDSAVACWSALQLVVKRRRPLVRAFASGFGERAASRRSRWEELGVSSPPGDERLARVLLERPRAVDYLREQCE
jgi:hypothetical protein